MFDPDYLFSFIPLVCAHICIPPLSYFMNNETPHYFFDELYEILPSEITNPKFVESLLLDADKPSWTLLSHLFVHADYNHMFNNLIACIQLSYPIYNEFGTFGLYTLFLTGGVASSVPSPLYKLRIKTLSKDLQLGTSVSHLYIPQALSKTWESTVYNMSSFFLKNIPVRFLGSSGAVCAFMGADLILFIKESVSMLSVEYRHHYQQHQSSRRPTQRNNGSSSQSSGSSLSRVDNARRLALLVNLLNILRSINYLSSEIGNAFASTSGKPFDFLMKSLEKKQTNHIAHIQGAVYGMVFAGVFAVAMPYIRRRRAQNL